MGQEGTEEEQNPKQGEKRRGQTGGRSPGGMSLAPSEQIQLVTLALSFPVWFGLSFVCLMESPSVASAVLELAVILQSQLFRLELQA